MNGLDQLSVDITRTFPVPLRALWALCASPAFFRRAGAKPDLGHMDFRIGGTYRYRFADGSEVWGEYQEIVPQERIVLSWSSDRPGGACADTTLRLELTDLGAESQLRLRHEGFADARWEGVFGRLAEDFRGQLGAAVRAGIEPRFTIPQRFELPVAQVFEAFVREDTITKFFVKSTTGPLREGERVEWRFDGLDDGFTVFCHELVPNERIRFTWGCAHVTFTFEDLGPRSRLTIASEGFELTQEGFDESYRECEGWRHVVLSLRLLLERGISLDDER